MKAYLFGRGACGLFLGPVAPVRIRTAASSRLYVAVDGRIDLVARGRRESLLPGELRVLDAGTAHCIDGTGRVLCIVADATAMSPAQLAERASTAEAPPPAEWLERAKAYFDRGVDAREET